MKGKENRTKNAHTQRLGIPIISRLFISVSFEGEVSAWTNPGGTDRTSEGARGAILGFFCRVMPRRRRSDFIKRKCGNPSSDLKTFVVENNGGSPALDNGGPPLLSSELIFLTNYIINSCRRRIDIKGGGDFFGAKKDSARLKTGGRFWCPRDLLAEQESTKNQRLCNTNHPRRERLSKHNGHNPSTPTYERGAQ